MHTYIHTCAHTDTYTYTHTTQIIQIHTFTQVPLQPHLCADTARKLEELVNEVQVRRRFVLVTFVMTLTIN